MAPDAATDQVIATCGGDAREAVKALIVANEFLEREIKRRFRDDICVARSAGGSIRIRANGTMGQAKVKNRSTLDFALKFPRCSLCGGDRTTTTREHMPPRSLFDNKHRPDKLVMPACLECNKGTSTADLTASLISRWAIESSPESQTDHRKLAAQARRQAPELVNEWLSRDNPIQQIGARQHLARFGVNAPPNAKFATIGPLTIRQLNIFSHKVALALYFEHFGKPLSNDGRVQAIWKTKEDFFRNGVPYELLELMGKYGTLTQGRWNASETFEYRYDLHTSDGLFGCFARLRQGLFVLGFAIADARMLVDSPGLDGEWIMPRNLLGNNPHFSKKHG